MNPNFDFKTVLRCPGAHERLMELEWDGEDILEAIDLVLKDSEVVFTMRCDNGALGGSSSCTMHAWLGMYFWNSDFGEGVEGPYESTNELRDAQSFHLEAELLVQGDPNTIMGLEYSIMSSLDDALDIASKLILSGMKIKVNNNLYKLTNVGLEKCTE